jgi:hypothetical protein
MEIYSDYRTSTFIVNERELELRAERARVAAERVQQPAARQVTSTGSLVGAARTSH